MASDCKWLLAGARIGEIIARKLTLKDRMERPVWSRQIENLYYRLQPIAEIECRLWMYAEQLRFSRKRSDRLKVAPMRHNRWLDWSISTGGIGPAYAFTADTYAHAICSHLG
jgi:hypothetical protein